MHRRGRANEFPVGVASVFLEAGAGRYVEPHPAGQGAMSPKVGLRRHRPATSVLAFV